jgi:phage anti-repressor protein
MADLIPFATRQIGTDDIPTVDARDLYEYLAIETEYALWIRRVLKRAKLLENVDYIVFFKNDGNPKGGRPAHEHHLSFDAAKHIAMMSSAEKGHEARTYFIQKEKELEALKRNPAAILDAYPELRAIADLAVGTARARTEAEAAHRVAAQAQTEALQANANAQRAMETQLFYTVAEYVYINKLQAKIPENAYKACSDHLRCYCMDRNIPFRKVPVGGKRWDDEYGYHQSVYAEALPGWLKRRFAQQPLQVLHPTHQERD